MYSQVKMGRDVGDCVVCLTEKEGEMLPLPGPVCGRAFGGK